METYNIHAAKTHLSTLIARAEAGEEVIISRANKPVVKLVAIKPPAKPRRPGSGRDEVLYVAPDFDSTPDDVIEDWYGDA